MPRKTPARLALLTAASALVLTGVTGAAPSTPGRAMAGGNDTLHPPACAPPTAEDAGCLLTVASDVGGSPQNRAAADPRPFTAADLQDAYALPSDLLGNRQTIAVVAPYDASKAAADLAVYRQANDLPACTADFPCFRKVNQRGGGDLPPANPTWALNAVAGLEVASAACPNCLLLLVETDDTSAASQGEAVDTAVRLGADAVAVMYGMYEYEGMMADRGHFAHPGVAITAASGNGFMNGVGRQLAPASFDTVIAVGSTALERSGNARGWTETASPGSGSGCSVEVPRPAWQPKGACGDKRTVGDVAAVSDPNTPIAIYSTHGHPGWISVSGTPLGAALVAGVYALAGNTDTINPGSHLYRHRGQLFDVTSGSNGSCGGSYLCTSVRGYDGPTGLGTPYGIGAF